MCWLNYLLFQIAQILDDTHVVVMAVNYVYKNENWRRIITHKKEQLNEVKTLIGLGYFFKLPYKI